VSISGNSGDTVLSVAVAIANALKISVGELAGISSHKVVPGRRHRDCGAGLDRGRSETSAGRGRRGIGEELADCVDQLRTPLHRPIRLNYGHR
jgi:hypothetical protein